MWENGAKTGKENGNTRNKTKQFEKIKKWVSAEMLAFNMTFLYSYRYFYQHRLNRTRCRKCAFELNKSFSFGTLKASYWEHFLYKRYCKYTKLIHRK